MSALGHLFMREIIYWLSLLLCLNILCLTSNQRSNSYFFTSSLIKLYLKPFLQIFLKALTAGDHTLLEEIHPFHLATKYIINIRKHDLCYGDSLSCVCNISKGSLFWSHKSRTKTYCNVMCSHFGLPLDRYYIFLQELDHKHQR
jgi:hypothetical protein